MYSVFVLHNLQLMPHMQAFLLVTRARWMGGGGNVVKNVFGDSVHLMPIYWTTKMAEAQIGDRQRSWPFIKDLPACYKPALEQAYTPISIFVLPTLSHLIRWPVLKWWGLWIILLGLESAWHRMLNNDCLKELNDHKTELQKWMDFRDHRVQEPDFIEKGVKSWNKLPEIPKRLAATTNQGFWFLARPFSTRKTNVSELEVVLVFMKHLSVLCVCVYISVCTGSQLISFGLWYKREKNGSSLSNALIL